MFSHGAPTSSIELRSGRRQIAYLKLLATHWNLVMPNLTLRRSLLLGQIEQLNLRQQAVMRLANVCADLIGYEFDHHNALEDARQRAAKIILAAVP